MLKVQMRTNLAAFQRGLTDFQKRQVPFAAASAINAIATAVRADIRTSMQETFAHPKPYTLNSTYLRRATKSDLRALVGFKTGGAGNATWKYLSPEVAGGTRNIKGFERRIDADVSGAGAIVPGQGARLDQYGNVSRAQLGLIIASLGPAAAGAPLTGRLAKRGKAKLNHPRSAGGAHAYFVAKSKRTGKPIGIYQLVGKGQVAPVLLFTATTPQYQARWPLADVVLKSIDKNRHGAFERAWAQALATAR